MSEIFHALPGIEVPVGAIKTSLNRMWSDAAESGSPAPSAEAGKATQVNFVLHFGFNTTAEDAVAQFRTAVAFSRRYPCRVVVLCPMHDDAVEAEVRAKVYGECHLGKTKGDTRCCEFVILNYSFNARPFIEDQVSICLSTDLPLYYWAHRFTSPARINHFRYLLTRATRVLMDSAQVPPEALTYAWPRPETVRDLAHARLLPVRQTIGQFLSGFSPAQLVADLRAVTIVHQPAYTAEAHVLLEWLRVRLHACGAGPDTFAAEVVPAASAEAATFDLTLGYHSSSRFHWQADLQLGTGQFTADYGHGVTTLPTAVSLLAPEAALGEAMFF